MYVCVGLAVFRKGTLHLVVGAQARSMSPKYQFKAHWVEVRAHELWIKEQNWQQTWFGLLCGS